MSLHQLADTLAVLRPDLGVSPRPLTPTVYEELDRDFDGFRGHWLFSEYRFDTPWPSWERHPAGEEIVMLLEGQARLRLQTEDGERLLLLETPGSYAIVPRGVWHTAEPLEPTRMLFVTPGEGTENRPID